MGKRRLVLAPLVSSLIFHASAQAGRLFGTANLSLQSTDQVNGVLRADSTVDEHSWSNTSQQTILINYEDVVFTKNSLRLGANLYRQKLSGAIEQVRPIYSMDLRSFGYFLSTSYSPYHLPAGPDSLGLEHNNIYYRDWRNTVSVNMPRYPSASFIYNETKVFDQQTPRRFDSKSTTTVLESDYTLGPASVRGNYNRLIQQDRTYPGNLFKNQSYTGALAFNQNFSRVGYVTAAYSYYDSRTTNSALPSPNPVLVRTHSVNLLYSSHQYGGVSLTSSYSGRFSDNQLATGPNRPRDETASGQLSYAPLRFLEFDLLKAYQTSTESGNNLITEYTTLSSTITRFLRRGVDTRLTANRTWFQKSAQTTPDNPSGAYSLDTYYGSLAFAPLGYVKTLVDMSISHNSRPIDSTQRFQVSRSVNAQLAFSRRLEGRLTALWLDQASYLRLDNSFSVSYNAGLTYYPKGNMNVNVSYLRTENHAGATAKTGVFSGFASYSFRRAFIIYLSANRQILETADASFPQNQIDLEPYSLNASLQLFLSSKTTVTLGYLYSKTPTSATARSIGRQYTTNVNIQF